MKFYPRQIFEGFVRSAPEGERVRSRAAPEGASGFRGTARSAVGTQERRTGVLARVLTLRFLPQAVGAARGLASPFLPRSRPTDSGHPDCLPVVGWARPTQPGFFRLPRCGRLVAVVPDGALARRAVRWERLAEPTALAGLSKGDLQ